MGTPTRGVDRRLRIATAQFAVSDDVDRNARAMVRWIRRARDRRADVVHFCEGALSGYGGVDFDSFDGFDWDRLRARAHDVAAAARDEGLWVVFGSAHRRTGSLRPHNSVYVVDDRGRLVDRYDKRFVAGGASGDDGELAHFSPGNRACVVTIRGVRCGVLICHEYRYPELVRDLVRRGAEVLLHSFHAANMNAERVAATRAQVGERNVATSGGTSLPEITMPASMIAAAASSHLWISAANSSARHSCFPAFFVRPDGVVTGRLRRHVPGVLLSTVDTALALYDSTGPWRHRAMRGTLHSGRRVDDPRSRDRHSF